MTPAARTARLWFTLYLCVTLDLWAPRGTLPPAVERATEEMLVLLTLYP